MRAPGVAHKPRHSVEHVLLIYRQSGLLLQHVSAAGIATLAPDAVAGMLNAIQTFMGESFAHSEKIDRLCVGDVQVWIQSGPQADLAAVVRGSAPPELEQVLRNAVDRIHCELAHELDIFPTTGTEIEAARPYLEACLQSSPSAQ